MENSQVKRGSSGAVIQSPSSAVLGGSGGMRHGLIILYNVIIVT